ncbi:MAG: response regulator, partial [Bacteroidota bacterium]
MSKQVYSIVICDSQYLIVEALKTIIDRWPEYAVQGYANNIRDLNEKLQTLKPDFLITDFRTIERVAFETVGNIMKEFTDLHTIILTNQLNRNELNELNRIGIKSILYKTATDDDIKAALDAALKNKKYYSDEVLDV